MRKRQRKAQFILVSIGLTLIVLTYFYYPQINKDFKSPNNQNAQEKSIEKSNIDPNSD